jgi:hypothetical protein
LREPDVTLAALNKWETPRNSKEGEKTLQRKMDLALGSQFAAISIVLALRTEKVIHCKCQKKKKTYSIFFSIFSLRTEVGYKLLISVSADEENNVKL